MRQTNISVKTMTDYHLESFIRCPYKFYYQHVLSSHSSKVQWRQVVQFAMNQVVEHYYRLPLDSQNTISAMKLINKSWEHVENFFH